MPQSKFQYEQLEVGYEFPPVSYDISTEAISKYLEATDESSNLYYQPDNSQTLTGLVPPLAIAAYAMTALSQNLAFPPGTIHVSQELEFIKELMAGSRITCRAQLSRKHERRNLHLFAIDLSVLDQNQDIVLLGKTSFILPNPDIEDLK